MSEETDFFEPLNKFKQKIIKFQLLKIFFTSMCILCCSLAANGQVLKLYGYSQPVIGGAFEEKTNAQANAGNETVSTATEAMRFYVFADVKKGSFITFTSIWIKGKPYQFKSNRIHTFPFVVSTAIAGAPLQADTLITKTTGTVFQFINLTPHAEDYKNKPAAKLIASNDLVIFYTINRKRKMATLTHLKNISPVFVQ